MANLKAEQVCRKVAIDMFTGIVQMTPVKTGLARGNWFPSFNTPSAESTTTPSPGGVDVVSRASTTANAWNGQGSIFLVNNLPYIQALENGSSTQAPAGMVRVTVTRFQDIINEAVR